MGHMDVATAARIWGMGERWARMLCQRGRVAGAVLQGGTYRIPEGAPRPFDMRTLRNMPKGYGDLLARVDELRAKLGQRRPLTEGELQRLREEFLIEHTYDSNAIEGNGLTLRETALVLSGVTIEGRPLKDHLEAVGHKEAFLFIQDQIDAPLSGALFRQIHALVLMDRPSYRGAWRDIRVAIAGSPHRPPDPVLIPRLIDDLLKRHEAREARMHPLHSASLFHLELEEIHPFVDGNGRTGRLILDLMLMRRGYLPVNVKFEDRARYYDAFDAHLRGEGPGRMALLIAEREEDRLRRWLDALPERRRHGKSRRT